MWAPCAIPRCWDRRTDLTISASIQASQLREFDCVTLHCEFGVSPLEIGGFGAIPPSPPILHKGLLPFIGQQAFFVSIGRTRAVRPAIVWAVDIGGRPCSEAQAQAT